MSVVQFYATEVGIDLQFPLVDHTGAPLAEAPLAGYPKLFVEGLAASPITLAATPTLGTYRHVVPPGTWSVAAGEVMHFYECYIEWRHADGRIILSDAFEIVVVKAPSTSL